MMFFTVLMDTESNLAAKFIEDNPLDVRNLDI
jgi:hypothetical protein